MKPSSFFCFAFSSLLFAQVPAFAFTPDDMETGKRLFLITQPEPHLPEGMVIPHAPNYRKLFDELSKKGSIYGFDLQTYKETTQFPARDSLIMKEDGSLIFSTGMAGKTPELYSGAMRTEIQTLNRVQLSLVGTGVRMAVPFGSSGRESKELQHNFDALSEIWSVGETPIYLEGGNTFFATNSKGEKKLIIPRNVFDFNVEMLGKNKTVDQLLKAFDLSSFDQVVLLDIDNEFRMLLFPHLDMFMSIGPKGNVFIQDYNLSLTVLKRIQGISKSGLEPTRKMGEIASPTLTRVMEQMKDAGFVMRRVPAVYHTNVETPITPLINLMNGISGYSEKADRFYFIAAGVYFHSAEVSQAMMTAFTNGVKAVVENVTDKKCDVHFLGADSTGSFEETQLEINKLHAGLHCLSAPLALTGQMTDAELNVQWNKQQALDWRLRGNILFKKGVFDGALAFYSKSREFFVTAAVNRNLAHALMKLAVLNSRDRKSMLEEAEALCNEAKILAQGDTEYLKKLDTSLAEIARLKKQ